ncbi:MAG: MarR family transcriptional regulator [Oligoflexia bacterium]|nr:MarR family transcriptional regulator [Oligoflexia bacterium]
MTSKSLSVAAAVWEGILKLQRKTRLLAVIEGLAPGEAGPGLSYNEGLLLHILQTTPNKNVKEISELLHLERSWVSRLVQGLEKRGLLRARPSSEDKRNKLLTITAKGESAIVALSAFRLRVMDQALADLSSKERQELAKLTEVLADGFKAPRLFSELGGDPVDAELARLSWEIGVLGDDYMHSGMNVTQYQILWMLGCYQERFVSASELHQYLPFDMSTVSRTLVAFEEEGLVEREKLGRDRRANSVTLERKGQQKLRANLECAAENIARASNGQPGMLERLAELLNRATQVTPERHRDRIKTLELYPAEAGEMLKDFEAYCTNKLGRTPIGPSKRGSRKQRFALCQDRQLMGVLEIERAEESGTISSFLMAGEMLPERECAKVLKNFFKPEAE